MKRIALALSLQLGCYASHDVRPNELPSLNGWTRDTPTELHDFRGRPIRVDERSRLYLTAEGGDTVGGEFDRIAVQGGRFVGRTTDGKVVNLQLPQISEASVDTYSRGRTIAGWITVGALVVGAVLAFTVLSLQQSGSCGASTSCAGIDTGSGSPPTH